MYSNLEFLGSALDAEDTFTLAVVRSTKGIIMGRKQRGYAAGKLVVPGGKNHYYLGATGVAMVPGSQNASRELYEETGVDVPSDSFQQRGILHVSDEEDNRDVWLFSVTSRAQQPTDSSELTDVHWIPE